MDTLMQIALIMWVALGFIYVAMAFADGFTRKRDVIEALFIGIAWPLVVIVGILAAAARWFIRFLKMPW